MIKQTTSFKTPNVKVVRCPKCKTKVMDIESGSKPFKSSATSMAISLKCNKCRNSVRVELINLI